MQMMELVIQNLLLFYFIVTYLGICAGLMITENLLIRRGNRRGLLLFLLLVGVLSFGIFAACPVSSTAAPRDIVKMEVKSNGSTTGMQIAMIERSAGNAKKELIALGELVLQEDDNSRSCGAWEIYLRGRAGVCGNDRADDAGTEGQNRWVQRSILLLSGTARENGGSRAECGRSAMGSCFESRIGVSAGIDPDFTLAACVTKT